MSKWIVKMEREIEEPAIEVMEQDTQPTQEEMEEFFAEQGYGDDPEYSGYEVVKEV